MSTIQNLHFSFYEFPFQVKRNKYLKSSNMLPNLNREISSDVYETLSKILFLSTLIYSSSKKFLAFNIAFN